MVRNDHHVRRVTDHASLSLDSLVGERHVEIDCSGVHNRGRAVRIRASAIIRRAYRSERDSHVFDGPVQKVAVSRIADNDIV